MNDLLGGIAKVLLNGKRIECNPSLSLRQILERHYSYPTVSGDGQIVYLSRDKVATFHVVYYEKEIPGDNLGAMRRDPDLDTENSITLVPIDGYRRIEDIVRTIVTTDGHYAHVTSSHKCIYATHETLSHENVLKALKVSYRCLYSIADLEPLKDLNVSAFYEDEVSCVWLNRGKIVHCLPNNDETRLKWDVKMRIMIMVNYQREHYEVPDYIVNYMADMKTGAIIAAGDLYIVRRKSDTDPKGGRVMAIIDPKCRGHVNGKVIGPESILYTDLHPKWNGVHPKVAAGMISSIYDSWVRGDIPAYPKVEDAIAMVGVFQALLFVRV